MICELCGKNPAIYTAQIEGTLMKVCQDCSRFGNVKGKSAVKIVIEEKKKFTRTEPDYVFLQGYGSLVKRAREKQGLTQDQMAKKLNERESVLHQIESEHFKPSIDLARKLERMLHVKIVEEIKNEESSANNVSGNASRTPSGRNAGNATSKSSEGVTLGDFIRKK